MPAMLGAEEEAAAREVLRFLEDLARQLEHFHARMRGWWHPYRFTAEYVRVRDEEGQRESPPPSLVGTYSIRVKAKAKRLDSVLIPSDRMRGFYIFAGVAPFATFSFHRADWDDTPHMQGAVCTICIPALEPPFFRLEAQQFVRTMFGCRMRFLESAYVLGVLETGLHSRA